MSSCSRGHSEITTETKEQQGVANFGDTAEFANGGKLAGWAKARKSLYLKLVELDRVKKPPPARRTETWNFKGKPWNICITG